MALDLLDLRRFENKRMVQSLVGARGGTVFQIDEVAKAVAIVGEEWRGVDRGVGDSAADSRCLRLWRLEPSCLLHGVLYPQRKTEKEDEFPVAQTEGRTRMIKNGDKKL